MSFIHFKILKYLKKILGRYYHGFEMFEIFGTICDLNDLRIENYKQYNIIACSFKMCYVSLRNLQVLPD